MVTIHAHTHTLRTVFRTGSAGVFFLVAPVTLATARPAVVGAASSDIMATKFTLPAVGVAVTMTGCSFTLRAAGVALAGVAFTLKCNTTNSHWSSVWVCLFILFRQYLQVLLIMISMFCPTFYLILIITLIISGLHWRLKAMLETFFERQLLKDIYWSLQFRILYFFIHCLALFFVFTVLLRSDSGINWIKDNV